MDLSEAVEDSRVVSVSVGPDGSASALLASLEDRMRILGRDMPPPEDRPYFPPTRTENPFAATFLRHDGTAELQTTQLDGLHLALPRVQPLPGDEVLVVGSRCMNSASGPEENASVYGADGDKLRSFTLGDGIQDVQTTASGDIWVSYFDEGVYGNYGWDQPLGHSGLMRFDGTGGAVWRYDPPDPQRPIDDCYALDVGSDSTWACYYSDFPVVRIQGDEIRMWQNEVSGAHAIAATDGAVLFVGGYQENASRVVLARLGAESTDPIATFELRTPDGLVLREASAIGRGPVLHVFNGPDWFRVDLRTLL
jgi:hypothetical protein